MQIWKLECTLSVGNVRHCGSEKERGSSLPCNKLLDDNVAHDVVKLLSFWYSNQSVSVRWPNTQSESFAIQNGTRQGSVLSPFLFTRYIRELLSGVINSNIGCNIGGYMVNILAYADDLVLLDKL